MKKAIEIRNRFQGRIDIDRGRAVFGEAEDHSRRNESEIFESV
jgi:hypothetical protein